MGCDIHICIQRQTPGGTWHEVPYQKVYRILGDAPVNGYPKCPDVFDNRNYNLFAILANVRNGRGFAGIATGQGWPSIAPDRGWPEDFDPEKVDIDPSESKRRYMGDHSFTWVSLDELKAFPWDATTTLYGVVPAEDYERLSAVDNTPTSYSAGISGPGIVTYNPVEYLAARRSNKLAPRPYVRMSWTESARSATGDWPGQVIPWLETLAEGRPLRLVMGFDS